MQVSSNIRTDTNILAPARSPAARPQVARPPLGGRQQVAALAAQWRPARRRQTMSALAETETTLKDAAARYGPSIVGLGRGWGTGTGVVIAPGQVLTVAHALARPHSGRAAGGAGRARG